MAEKDESELLGGADRSFARAMRTTREARGLTQGELAAELKARGFAHLGQVTLSRIEQGKRAARLGEAKAIAAALAQPLSAMMGPAAGVLGILAPMLDRPRQAALEIEAFRTQSREIGALWAQLENDVEFAGRVSAGMELELADDPESAQIVDAYMRSVAVILDRDPQSESESAYRDGYAWQREQDGEAENTAE